MSKTKCAKRESEVTIKLKKYTTLYNRYNVGTPYPWILLPRWVESLDAQTIDIEGPLYHAV